MYWSKLFIPTLREDPAQAESPEHALLMRAGYIRPLSHGRYHDLFAAQRSLVKIQAIVREEMAASGAQEVALGSITPLAFAVENIALELQSYREFPQIWHQFRGAEQSSYSLDLTPEARDESSAKLRAAYARVLDRCGIGHIDAGAAYMAPSDAGQDFVVRGDGESAPLETAVGIPPPLTAADSDESLAPEEFHTPGIGSIDDLARFTSLPATSLIKTLACLARDKPVMVLLRGDHQLSEAKLKQVMETSYTGFASASQIREWLGADAGSLGPVGVTNMPILADEALRGRRHLVAGANRNDYHLRHVTPGVDFQARFADLRQVAPGDLSASTGAPLKIEKVLKLASFRKLWNEYSSPARPIWLGEYDLSLDRILLAAAHAHRDKDGLALPPSTAPFTVTIVPIDYNAPELRAAAEQLYEAAKSAGLDVALDDRDLRAGVKFKDADLVGIPYRVNIGKKLAQGMVEVVARHPKQSTDVPLAEAVAFILQAEADFSEGC
jgi:prolyl-tRNA synthetase